ncbi:MAG: tail fiber protein [Porticoccus sp.]|nr:tail fiber protein [Porticoccus sp.]MBQ0807137.1 tail fiber protein [Porticoccus sp.]
MATISSSAFACSVNSTSSTFAASPLTIKTNISVRDHEALNLKSSDAANTTNNPAMEESVIIGLRSLT